MPTLPEPPYYTVIFTSQRTEGDNGYGEMSKLMLSLAEQQPGFLGIESVRNADGKGITISYWKTLEDMKHWKANTQHQVAQKLGKERWYKQYDVHIAKVESNYSLAENESE